MRTVFVSHNDLGLACLEELDRLGADIRAVLTRPNLDRISDQTDFTDFTAERDVPLHRVDSINTDAWVDRLGQYNPGPVAARPGTRAHRLEPHQRPRRDGAHDVSPRRSGRRG
jgi:methionyl-tRNA formyltransferase